MSENSSYEELCKRVHILTQPVRLQIINILKKSAEPLYIEQIAKQIGDVTRRTVSFHLTTLSQHGFVEGEFREIIPPNSPSGKGAKFYHLTDKVQETFNEFINCSEPQ